jgi:flagellin
MGLRIQNNIEALNAHRNLGISSSNMSKSLEKLSSGFRINKAADDAAGMSVSQQMRADITSYKVAGRNVSEANAMLQVAEGAMDQIGNMLTRLKELATQAASANSGGNLTKINAEGNKLMN